MFAEELEFYTDQKSKAEDKNDDFGKRMRSCDQEAMFQQMQEFLESKRKNAEMPVRNFYNNTFG